MGGVGRLFSNPNSAKLYREIVRYLPKERRKEFLRSWVVNNLFRGDRIRRSFERKMGCTLPALIDITPTEKCNLNCRGCYALGYGREREMTTDEVRLLVSEARSLGIYLIGLLGGEPFARKDLFEVVRDNKDIAFRISTNGTVMDEEILNNLKLCGNLVTFFSLEGFEAETDAWRGEGVYDQVLHSMKVLKREHVLFGFSVLLHRKNFGQVVSAKFLDAMRDAGCKFGLFFPYGPAGDNARYDLRLSEAQIAECFAELDGRSGDYTMLFIKEGYTAPDKNGRYFAEKGCRAGVTVNITPGGNVEPCNGIQFYTENVFEVGLENVFRSRFYKEIFDCVRRHDGRCVSMFQPMQVLEIIGNNGAKGSYPRSLPTYSNYAHCYPDIPSKNPQRIQTAGEMGR